jgi:hypothetical protein
MVALVLTVLNSTLKPGLLCLFGRRYRACARCLCWPADDSSPLPDVGDTRLQCNLSFTNALDGVNGAGCVEGGVDLNDAMGGRVAPSQRIIYDCDPSTKLTLVSSPSAGTLN